MSRCHIYQMSDIGFNCLWSLCVHVCVFVQLSSLEPIKVLDFGSENILTKCGLFGSILDKLGCLRFQNGLLVFRLGFVFSKLTGFKFRLLFCIV